MIGGAGPKERAGRPPRLKRNCCMPPTLMTPNLAQRLAAVHAAVIALTACARDLPAQAPKSAAAQAPSAAEAAAAPAPEAGMRPLPDFTQLVERYGAAVVNVEVVEKPRGGG